MKITKKEKKNNKTIVKDGSKAYIQQFSILNTDRVTKFTLIIRLIIFVVFFNDNLFKSMNLKKLTKYKTLPNILESFFLFLEKFSSI